MDMIVSKIAAMRGITMEEAYAQAAARKVAAPAPAPEPAPAPRSRKLMTADERLQASLRIAAEAVPSARFSRGSWLFGGKRVGDTKPHRAESAVDRALYDVKSLIRVDDEVRPPSRYAEEVDAITEARRVIALARETLGMEPST